jgi:hypothetical protein
MRKLTSNPHGGKEKGKRPSGVTAVSFASDRGQRLGTETDRVAVVEKGPVIALVFVGFPGGAWQMFTACISIVHPNIKTTGSSTLTL